MDEQIDCPLCEGAAFLLGILGTLAWYRCRYCGAECSAEVNQT